jgi:arginine decarboxylase
MYVELIRLGAGLKYIDIGGGLGIDYDGSQTNYEFSTNYTLSEYAGNVVYRIMATCDDAGVAHPHIVTEGGRAMVSHHSVLVFNVVGAHRLDDYKLPSPLENGVAKRTDVPRPLEDLLEAYRNVSVSRMLECYHDATQAREEALTLFKFGHLTLEDRAMVDRLFWATCLRMRNLLREMESVPEELDKLEYRLSDTYFCNLSIFQSLPDIWAIDQVFPVLPIHRLDEEPTREGTLADLTCDSDGKIDHFVDRQAVKRTLRLHDVREGEPYYLAAFLVGAYQETLGDLHNLFGDTNVVHVKMDEQWGWSLEQVVEGDTVKEVLGYLQYDVNQLYQAIRHDCERSVRAGRMTIAESRSMLSAYERGLSGYTYLE